jgi:hypothetical protein
MSAKARPHNFHNTESGYNHAVVLRFSWQTHCATNNR